MSQARAYPQPSRLSFPQDEEAHPWLRFALESYYQADVGVWQAIAQEAAKGRTLACAKGCSACCRSHTTIPIFPLELLGLYWFVTLKLSPEMRRQLKPQLAGHERGAPCPFLVEGACAVHPMRPLACRHFNVFGRVCAEGEDAYYSRREDVLTPIRSHQDAAIAAMLPFHGLTSEAQRRGAMQAGYIQGRARVLQDIDWGHLAARLGDD